MRKGLFLLGPSGTGKSTLAAALAAKASLEHVELDQWPIDGVDALGLRHEWNAFLYELQPGPLTREVLARAHAAGKLGAVISVPGLLVLPLAHIHSAEAHGFATAILYGEAPDCIRSFLRREEATGRRLPVEHWHANNDASWVNMGRPEYAPYRLLVFGASGHCETPALVAALEQRIAA